MAGTKGLQLIAAPIVMVLGVILLIASSFSDKCAESPVPAQQCVGTGHDVVFLWAGLALAVGGGVWWIVQLTRRGHGGVKDSEASG